MLFHAEIVHRDGTPVGYVRAASYGHTLGGAVGLAMIDGGGEPIDQKWIDAGTLGGRHRGHEVPGARLAQAAVRSREQEDQAVVEAEFFGRTGSKSSTSAVTCSMSWSCAPRRSRASPIRCLLEEALRPRLDAHVDIAHAFGLGTRRDERVLVIEEADAEHLVMRRDDPHLGHAEALVREEAPRRTDAGLVEDWAYSGVRWSPRCHRCAGVGRAGPPFSTFAG